MKFNCDALSVRLAARRKASEAWHPFFTIFPRKVGPNDCRALEWIERRRVYYRGVAVGTGTGSPVSVSVIRSRWEYRAKNPPLPAWPALPEGAV